MLGVSDIAELSGWILPDGTWIAVEEWWHLAALFDMRDTGMEILCTEESLRVLASGDEGQIRHHVATLGFVKLSRKIVDAYSLSNGQLRTLQGLLQFCDLESEFGLLQEANTEIKPVSVDRVMKLKNPKVLFSR
jgi:hypothetical protein